MNNNFDKKAIKKGLLPYLLLFIIMMGMIYGYSVFNNDVHRFSY